MFTSNFFYGNFCCGAPLNCCTKGWKGYRKGDAGCFEKQALVLINYGNATGADIFNLSEQIIDSVSKKFRITLEREVNVV